MPERDLYAILGIGRGATADEIRSAYRKLARRLHPDVNKSPDAQARFSEVQEAYDVLSDEAKRRLYDRTGRVGAGSAPPTAQWGGGLDIEFDDLGSMFDSFFRGRGAPAGSAPRPRRGADARRTLTVDLETVARGTTVRTLTPTGQEVDVKIPAGCADGAQLRLRGRGEASKSGGEAGDLLLTVRVTPHPLYTRGRPNEPDPKSLDLWLTLPVTITEATLGATIDVPTLEGPVRLAVPEQTSSGRQLRLKGRGLRSADGRKGDLYARIRIVPPDPARLEEGERELLRRIGERLPSPRTDLPGGA